MLKTTWLADTSHGHKARRRRSYRCYSTIAWIAAHTEHIELLAFVTATPFRYPAMLATAATTVARNGENTNALIGQQYAFTEMGMDTILGRVESADHVAALEVMGHDVIPTVTTF